MEPEIRADDQRRAATGIAVAVALSVPLWAGILLLVGNPWFQKAVLYFLCLAVAALAIWLAKAVSPDPAASPHS